MRRSSSIVMRVTVSNSCSYKETLVGGNLEYISPNKFGYYRKHSEVITLSMLIFDVDVFKVVLS